MKYKKITFILSAITFVFVGRNLNAQVVKTFNYTGSLQTWTIPSCISSITITAYGAAGGASNYQNLGPYPGGSGAEITGTFTVVTGNVLDIMVGQKGLINNEGSGGGGSFVWNASNSNSLMVAAGGGGGSYSTETGGAGSSDSIPTIGAGYDGGSAPGGVGGNGGSGGSCVTYGGGGAGAGWFSNGSDGSSCGGYAGGSGGNTPLSGGAGGLSNVVNGCVKSSSGGYGGGGASTCYGGGGGSGYNGGGGAIAFNTGWNAGGGGGSYNVGTNQSNFAGIDTGNGMVTITYISDTVGTVTGHLISGVSCFGGSNGSVSAIITGASPIYIYSWAPVGGSGDTATGLSAGTYTITVHDLCAHSVSASVTVTQPASALSAIAVVANNVGCNGGSNGSLTASVSGGTGPYTYSWTPAGGTGSVAFGLSAGTYQLKVTDNNGCTASASAIITQPNAVSIFANTSANVLCNGGNTGSAVSNTSGGTSPYFYLWTPVGGTATSATGLSAGTYTITITDDCGGTATASVVITQPNPLNVTASTQNNVICNGDNTGTVLATVGGGSTPYTYSWTGGQTTAIVNSLSAGRYTVNVTDANGCTSSAATSITQPSAITMASNMKPDDGTHDGSAWVSVSGGTSPYMYLWNPGGNTTDSISHDSAGMYCCKITDVNGCKDSICVTVQSDAGISDIESVTGQITIYPNPNNGVFTLVIASEAKQSPNTIEVYNVLGEKVYSHSSIVNYPLSINLSDHPNGIYLYRVISTENGNLLGQGKLVIER